MARALEDWKVLPHGPLERVGDSILTVVGRFDMPLTEFERRMTVVRLGGGRTVVFSAIALDEPRMAALEEFGAPAFLIIPNHLHRQDALIWKKRYPELVVVAPSGAEAAAAEVVAVDTTTPDFGDPRVRFVEIAGTGGRDSALECEEDRGLTLVLNDVVGHMPHESGWVLRTMGFAGKKPRVPLVVRLGIIRDKKAFRAQLEGWAEQNVVRILVSHGAPIDVDPKGALREMASTL